MLLVLLLVGYGTISTTMSAYIHECDRLHTVNRVALSTLYHLHFTYSRAVFDFIPNWQFGWNLECFLGGRGVDGSDVL